MLDVDRVSVVSPGAYLERALLLVKWKEFDVDWTQAFVDGRRFPHDQPVRVDRSFRHQLHREVAVSATYRRTHMHAQDNCSD